MVALLSSAQQDSAFLEVIRRNHGVSLIDPIAIDVCATLKDQLAGGAADTASNVYVAGVGNNRIREITPDGAVPTLIGSGALGFADGPAASIQFSEPAGIAVDTAITIYVTSEGNDRIRKIMPQR